MDEIGFVTPTPEPVDFAISFTTTSMALTKSYDSPSASEALLQCQ